MGDIYELDCRNCGYQQQLFEGAGMSATQQAMICTDCAELVSVLTRIDYVPSELIQQFAQRIGRCPKCNGANLKGWPESHPCPKCGQAINLEGPIGCWD